MEKTGLQYEPQANVKWTKRGSSDNMKAIKKFVNFSQLRGDSKYLKISKEIPFLKSHENCYEVYTKETMLSGFLET